MGGYDGSIRIKALLNHSPFDRGIRSMSNSAKALQSTLMKLAGAVGLAFGAAAIVNFGRESVRAASNLSNAWLGLQSIVEGQGRSFGKAKSFIEEYISDGLVPLENAVTAYKNLAARGYDDTQIRQLMLALKDSAAFGRQSSYSLGEAIQTATEGLKNENSILVDNAGVTKNVAKMWDDYAKSIGTTANRLTQAQKIEAEVNGILQETRFQTGDAAKLVSTYSGQVAMLAFQFQQLKVQVGNALMPIVQAVLPGVNAIISALLKLAKVFAQVTALLFGKPNIGNMGQVSANEDIASSGQAAADATDKLADATAGAGDASKKAAKDMKGVLAGFDELNILADQAAGSVDGAAGGIGAGGIDAAVPELDTDGGAILEVGEAFRTLGEIFRDTLDEMLAGIPRLKEAFLEFASSFNGFNQTLYDAFQFDGVLERVEQLGRDLAGAFNALVSAVDWQLWGRSLGAGLNLGLQFLTEFLYTFGWGSLGRGLADLVNGLVYEVDWYDFGRLLWAQFEISLETFAGFFTGLDMPALAQAASNLIMGFFDEMKATIARIQWGEIGAQIAAFLSGVDWGGILASVWAAVQAAVAAGFDFLEGVIREGSPGLLAAVSVLAGVLGVKFAAEVVPNIAAVATAFVSFFKKIKDISVLLKYQMADLPGAINAVFGPGSTLVGIGGIVGGAALAFTNFFSMLQNGFSLANEALMLLGVALAGVGAVILGAPALVAGVVAGIAAVVGTLTAVLLGGGKAAYEASEDFRVMSNILEECEDSSGRSSAAMQTLEENIRNLNHSFSDIGAAQSLVEEIFAINENAKASADELELMATKVTLLNSMGLEGLHLTIDETTGRIVETKEATDRLIASLQKEAEAAALQELLVQAYKDRYQAVSDAEQAVKNINAAEQALKDTEEQLASTPWWDIEKHVALTEQQEKQTEALEAANEARSDAITAYDQLSGAIDTYAGSLTGLSEPEANVGVTLESRMSSVRQTIEGVSADMPGYGRNIGEGLEQGMEEGVSEEETKGIFSQIGDWFKDLFGIHSPSKVFEEFGGFLMSGLHNGLNGNLSPITELFSNLWESIRTGASETWADIQNSWASASSWFEDHVTSPLGSAFEATVGTVKNAVNGMIGAAEGMVNSVIKAVNWLISQLNKIRFDVPDWVPGVGGRSFGFHIQTVSPVRLPRLANGAVIPPNQQFAAILGDQRSGMNLEAPAALIKQMVMEGIQAAGGMGGEIHVTVESVLDGKMIAKNTVRHINAMTRSNGKPVLLT